MRRYLELKIAPPIIMLLCLVMIWSVSFIPMHFDLIGISAIIALFLFVSALFVGASAFWALKKAQTNIHPSLHLASSSLVTCGIYHYSRNPMYLSLLFLLLAVTVYLQSLVSIVICIFFVSYINRYQIKPEELHLEQQFGKSYLNYKGKVRRWL